MNPSARRAAVLLALMGCVTAVHAQDEDEDTREPPRLGTLLPKPKRPGPGDAPPLPDRLGPTFRMERVVSVRLAPGADAGELADLASRANVKVTVVRPPNRLRFADLEVEVGDPSQAAAALQAIPGVELAETNWVGAYDAVVPNDSLFKYQWNLVNPGGWGFKADADVDADEAWTNTQGRPEIIIAVIDSGVDWSHPDLDPRIFRNLAETEGGVNDVDDDANGLVDDFAGWDFAGGSNDITSASAHGTQVAGIIGAVGNNGVGIAGLAGGGSLSEGCTILAIGTGDPDPLSSALDDAILYAVDSGAKVINLSLSVPPQAAVEAALELAAASGVTIVCAAGNNLSTVAFPATDVNVIPVASTGGSDGLSSFSSPGPALADRGLAAPGEMVLTLTIAGGYKSTSGTSFAAPHVAAAAGLMLSLPGGAALAPDRVREILRSTVDPLPLGAEQVGAGRLNVARALAAVPP